MWTEIQPELVVQPMQPGTAATWRMFFDEIMVTHTFITSTYWKMLATNFQIVLMTTIESRGESYRNHSADDHGDHSCIAPSTNPSDCGHSSCDVSSTTRMSTWILSRWPQPWPWGRSRKGWELAEGHTYLQAPLHQFQSMGYSYVTWVEFPSRKLSWKWNIQYLYKDGLPIKHDFAFQVSFPES